MPEASSVTYCEPVADLVEDPAPPPAMSSHAETSIVEIRFSNFSADDTEITGDNRQLIPERRLLHAEAGIATAQHLQTAGSWLCDILGIETNSQTVWDIQSDGLQRKVFVGSRPLFAVLTAGNRVTSVSGAASVWAAQSLVDAAVSGVTPTLRYASAASMKFHWDREALGFCGLIPVAGHYAYGNTVQPSYTRGWYFVSPLDEDEVSRAARFVGASIACKFRTAICRGASLEGFKYSLQVADRWAVNRMRDRMPRSCRRTRRLAWLSQRAIAMTRRYRALNLLSVAYENTPLYGCFQESKHFLRMEWNSVASAVGYLHSHRDAIAATQSADSQAS